MMFTAKIKMVALVTATCLIVTGTGVVVATQVAQSGAPNSAISLPKAVAQETLPANSGSPAAAEQATLPTSPLSATLRIVSLPGKARVYINNEPRGQTPLLLANLDPGKYRVRLEMDGCDPNVRDIELERGKEKVEEFRLVSNVGKAVVDQTKSGNYSEGLWSYSFAKLKDDFKPNDRQGFLSYDEHPLLNPQSNDYIATPWGWMQWRDRVPNSGNWLPVAEKPTQGKQLPDPATHPEILQRMPSP